MEETKLNSLDAESQLGRPRNILFFSRSLVKTKPWFMTASLMVADILGLFFAGCVAVFLRNYLDDGVSLALYTNLWPAIGLFLLAYALSGLYSGTGTSAVDEMRKMIITTSLVFVMLASIAFLSKSGLDYSRGIFLLAWVLALVGLPVLRSATRKRLSRVGWWGVPVVVLGAGKTASGVIEFLYTHPELGLKPVAALDDDPSKALDWEGVPVLGGLRLASTLARDRGVRHALIAMPGAPWETLLQVVNRCSESFPYTILIPNLFGVASMWTATRDLGGTLGLELRQNLLQPLSVFLKRMADILGGIFLGVFSLPLFLGLAILIRLDSPGPVFFRQQRLGKRGQVFQALKFRTMEVDAEEKLLKLLTHNPQARAEYDRYHKLQGDPRVTKIGRLLRKFSLDELPQLWNVLKGEMSLVGPRAYLPEERSLLGESGSSILHVAPGITGLWQVSGRNRLTFKERIDLEEYYVRNWSIWLDIYVLAQTVPTVLHARGAY